VHGLPGVRTRLLLPSHRQLRHLPAEPEDRVPCGRMGGDLHLRGHLWRLSGGGRASMRSFLRPRGSRPALFSLTW